MHASADGSASARIAHLGRSVPARLCTVDELLGVMACEEIPQDGNLNAHSRLFVVEDAGIHVYKLFDMGDPRSRVQLDNLERVLAHAPVARSGSDPRSVPDEGDGQEADRIAWPGELIAREVDGEQRLIGYRMPRIVGRTLVDALLCRPAMAEVNALFMDLERTLSMLGPELCAADLHARNIIVDGSGCTHLVDPDAFSLVGGACTSSPLADAARIPVQLLCSGADAEGPVEEPRASQEIEASRSILASHAQDFGCMLRLYFSVLLGEGDVLAFSDEVLEAYLDHVERLPSCVGAARALRAWLDDAETTDWSRIATVDDEDAERATFAVFSKTDGYARILERLRAGGAFAGIG